MHQLLMLILCAFVGVSGSATNIRTFYSQMLLLLFFVFLQLVIANVVLCTYVAKCWYCCTLCFYS